MKKLNKSILALIICLVMSIMLSASASVIAAETIAPEATAVEETEPKSEKTQDVVYRFLTEELKLTPAAAAGIMGNIMIECSFIPVYSSNN